MHINDLFAKSVSRSAKWHRAGVDEWSALEWAGAMCGEAGEAANAAKKLKRMASDMPSINAPDRSFTDIEDAQTSIAEEAADTILYALMLMARVGVTDPESVIARVFNRKSVEYGFPERVGDALNLHAHVDGE